MEALPLRQIARDADIARKRARLAQILEMRAAKAIYFPIGSRYRSYCVWTWAANRPSVIPNEAPLHPID